MAHPYQKHGHKNDPKWMKGIKKYADGGAVEDDSPGIGERIARSMSEGRTMPQRALYNATRGDTVGQAIMGNQASEENLGRKRAINASDAQSVIRAVRRN